MKNKQASSVKPLPSEAEDPNNQQTANELRIDLTIGIRLPFSAQQVFRNSATGLGILYFIILLTIWLLLKYNLGSLADDVIQLFSNLSI